MELFIFYEKVIKREILGLKSSCEDAECYSILPKDYSFWFFSLVVLGGILLYLTSLWLNFSLPFSLYTFLYSEYILLKQMWIGIVMGIVSVGLLSYVPREIVIGVLGPGESFKGLFRAIIAGLFLDMCSHGILMIGVKLYERGASLGQMMAFLIASPWNSFSLSLILITLIGWKWTLSFVLLSVVIALISGFIFDFLVKKKVLPVNPHSYQIPKEFRLKTELQALLQNRTFHWGFFLSLLQKGFQGSTVIIKWTFFGVIIASAIRTFVPHDVFANYFGPTFLGLLLTILVSSIIEVCSEGSTPVAAEFMKQAPGNTFAFLMTGVSTDYTEIMVIRENCKSWAIALFLPVVTLPQVFCISLLINSTF